MARPSVQRHHERSLGLKSAILENVADEPSTEEIEAMVDRMCDSLEQSAKRTKRASDMVLGAIVLALIFLVLVAIKP